MALAALCASHTPLKDYRSPGDAVAREVADVFEQLRDFTREFAPDLVVVFAPDHFNGFFYRVMPAFCIGAAATGVGDWKTPAGPLPVDTETAERCVRALQAGGLDPAISYDMVVDHGATQILDQLFEWSKLPPVLPVFVNCAAPPRPPLERVALLGAELGAFARSLDRRVLVIGSGGLSHDPPIPTLAGAPPAVRERLVRGGDLSADERKVRQQRVIDDAERQTAGTSERTPLNPAWDERFLQCLVAHDDAALHGLDDEGITRDAGCGGHEIRTWIAAEAAARAAGAGDVRVRYYREIREWIAGFAAITIT